MMGKDQIGEQAETLLHQLRARKMTLVTAESCTGGLIAAELTSIPGSSDVVHGGFVTYANKAKQDMLGVEPDTLAQFGAVSEPTAQQMARGALAKTGADIAIAVTGIAGPGGGTAQKPVGLVYIACATGDRVICQKELFGDIGRSGIRRATVAAAMALALSTLR